MLGLTALTLLVSLALGASLAAIVLLCSLIIRDIRRNTLW